jgi:uncharacterized protein YbjT (DUF2867 family)
VRVLVTGAGGYIGSRLVPALVAARHEVRVGFRDPARAQQFTWHEQVEPVALDVTDEAAVALAVDGMDAVYYLVHGMGGRDFAETDRLSARLLADAAEASEVQRIVYLSGVVPDGPPERLSEHITSRLEVESILNLAAVTTLTLRAAIVIGSGSTSFEILRQISERLPVQAVPGWMAAQVQPIAVVDVVAVLVGALTAPVESRAYDIGGQDVLGYRDLLGLYAEVAGLTRPQVEVPLVPSHVMGHAAGVLTDLPASTVRALVESLHADMVCDERDFLDDLLPEGHRLVPLREAIERALGVGVQAGVPDPMGPLPGDPAWADGGRPDSLPRLAGLMGGAAGRLASRLMPLKP